MVKRKVQLEHEYTVLNLRDMPIDLVANLKAAAALGHTSMKGYVIGILEAHVEDLQKRGSLPKGR